MFQLTEEEKAWVVANCDHLKKLRFSPSLPHAFAEHDAVMLASVLNSDRAIAVNTDCKDFHKASGNHPHSPGYLIETGTIGKESSRT